MTAVEAPTTVLLESPFQSFGGKRPMIDFRRIGYGNRPIRDLSCLLGKDLANKSYASFHTMVC